MCRAIQYALRDDEMNEDEVKIMIYQWTVTVDVYLYRLGLMMQHVGEVSIGYNLSITAKVVQTVFKD